MFKLLLMTLLLMVGGLIAINKGYHNKVAQYGDTAKPYVDKAVGVAKKSYHGTKEVTSNTVIKVKNMTE